MRRIYLKYLLSFVIICYAIYFIVRYNLEDIHVPTELGSWDSSTKTRNESPTKVVLSFVVCESRLNESLNVVKSVLLFSRAPLHLVIFADDERRKQLNKTLTRWRNITSDQFDFELHKINFPEPDADYWLNLFRKCAAQRLFFPELLPHIDALVYVDTDTLFLGPVEELWAQFRQFNETHMTALAVEDDNVNVAWYPRFAKHPFYGKYGLNSGVMLMNLTRMRAFGWGGYLTPVMRAWSQHIPWGDQDIINIILSHHSECVHIVQCRYNHRAEQCAHGPACPSAAARGVFLLHGSRGSFYGDTQPAFRAVHDAISEHSFGSDPYKMLYRLERNLEGAAPSPCGALKRAFIKVPAETLKTLYPSYHTMSAKTGMR